MAAPVAELYDIDARHDPLLAECERARDLLNTSDQHAAMDELVRLANSGSIMSTLLVADALRTGRVYAQDLPGAEVGGGMAFGDALKLSLNCYRSLLKSGWSRRQTGTPIACVEDASSTPSARLPRPEPLARRETLRRNLA